MAAAARPRYADLVLVSSVPLTGGQIGQEDAHPLTQEFETDCVAGLRGLDCKRNPEELPGVAEGLDLEKR